MTLHSLENESVAALPSEAEDQIVDVGNSSSSVDEPPSQCELLQQLPWAARNCDFVREDVRGEICRQVVRGKLAKRRHVVLPRVFDATYLNDVVFPQLLCQFDPQHVTYNGGIAGTKDWKISCYLEVMEGGVPTASPHLDLLRVFQPLLEQCNDLFLYWYRQQHACNATRSKLLGVASKKEAKRCRRLMTFVTRYTPAPGEQALLKHVDGAGKVDGSCVVALPMEPGNEFEGGGLTFWDGQCRDENGNLKQDEIHYDTRSGDLAFIDRAVWHQADPITKGTRWALVIFYEVE